jgi:cytochrome oxidase assembly protein ShyY1
MATILAGISVSAVTRFVRQPRWLAWHLLLVVVLVSFTWLGRWQLDAFEHKAGHGVAAGDRRTAALDALSRPGGRLDEGDVGRRVTATGSYDPDGTRLVDGRDPQGGSGTGLWVVSMLRTADGVQPVVRGWVREHDDPEATAPSGEVTVTGLLQRSEGGPSGREAGDVGPDQLPYVATVTVLDVLRYSPGELYDGYLALRSEQPSTRAARPAPVSAQDLSSGGVGRWRNLAYALQWWLFAGAAVFFWFVVLRRAVQEQREPDHLPAPPDDAGPPSLVAPRRTT